MRALGRPRNLAPTPPGLPRRSLGAATAVNNRRAVGVILEELFNWTHSSWTSPAGTVGVVSLEGYGTAGSPAYDAYSDPDQTMYRIEKWSQLFYQGSPTGPPGYHSAHTDYIYSDTSTTLPGTYCDAASGDYQTCYSYVWGSTTIPGEYHPAESATTGASANAFGFEFPGGFGGAAGMTTYGASGLLPNTVYPLSIPFGGSVKLRYRKL